MSLLNRIGKHLIIVTTLMLVSVSTQAGSLDSNLSPEAVSRIIQKYQDKEFRDFRDFIFEVYLSGKVLFKRHEHHTLGDYVAHRQLEPKQQALISRMFGVYTRLKYQDDALQLLARLVAIPTLKVDELDSHQNPAFEKMQETLAAVADEFGLAYRNVDGRVYEFTVPGQKQGKLIGLHAHADVVPANESEWQLEDGTPIPPFQVHKVGDRVYGRGTQDDKNGVVAALFAMRTIQEENIALFNSMRLLVDTTEETTSTAIPYYLERHPTPDYNIALDGDYPVVIAEKGYGVVKTFFPVRAGEGPGGEVISITGGLAYNQIPSVSKVVIKTAQPFELISQINKLGEQFISSYGGDFSIQAQAGGAQVMLELRGMSAHSSEPQTGVNPVSRMLLFLHLLNGANLLQQNHVTDAARYAQDNWGLGFYGKRIGIDFSDEFMGPLTASFTKIALGAQGDDSLDKGLDKGLEVAVNLRIPVGKPLQEIEKDLSIALNTWQRATETVMRWEYQANAPMYRNPNGRWVNTMLDIASENLSLPRVFGSSAGGTSIHNLPNGVQFGLAIPGEKYTGHNANEFKSIPQFQLDLQIVTEMMVRLGQLETLD